MLGFSYFFSEAGVVPPQADIEKIIRYFIDVVPEHIIPLFIA
jgi:hypothetical protein